MKISVNIANDDAGPVAYLFLDSESGIACKDWGELGRLVKRFKALCKKEIPPTKKDE